MRTKQGKGEMVAIFTLTNKWVGKGYDNSKTPYDECPRWDIWGPNEAEDYAKSEYPIVIKAKPGVTIRQLKQALLELVVRLREHKEDELISDKYFPESSQK